MTSIHVRFAAGLTAALFATLPLAGFAQREESRPDVLVVGGTAAGVTAAVAAARRGETVTLVSDDGELGGILTGAMMDQWDLNLAPDGRSVEGGIFDEIYDRLGDAFTPAAAARLFAQMVAAQPRIDVVYDERPVAVSTVPLASGEAIDDVTFRDARSGDVMHLAAPYIVDATDDADLAALAGARYDVGRQDSGIDDRTQAVTLMFTVKGVDWRALADAYEPALNGAGGVLDRRAWGYSKTVAAYDSLSPDVLVRDLNLGLMPNGDVTVNAIDVVGIDGLRAADLSRARRLCEREAPHLVDYLRERVPGFERASVARFATDVYVRETRHVAGLEQLDTADVWLGKIPADTIGLSSYPIDLHPVDATNGDAYAPIRHVYGIPFGALVPRGITNLVLAGPSISASHLASGSARVIPTTIEEGEAAGVACAVADRAGIDLVAVARDPSRVALLRRELAQEGALVGTPGGEPRVRPSVLASRA